MPSDLKCFRVFIASPSGLANERTTFRDEIAASNDADAHARGFSFEARGWEDTLGGVGRPQSRINEDIRASDFMVVMLWDRWGSSPDVAASRFTSATEEEYYVGMECYKKKTMRQIVVFFKAVDLQQISDAGPQLQRVLKFRDHLESTKECLYEHFDTTENFRKRLRMHLSAWLRNAEKGENESTSARFAIRAAERGFAEGVLGTRKERSSETDDDPVTAKAWGLARVGRLTEAEIEFAKGAAGQNGLRPKVEYGAFLLSLGRVDQARTAIEGAISTAEVQKDQVALFNGYGLLGRIFEIRGDLDRAEEAIDKALTIGNMLQNLSMMAAASMNLGNVLFRKHDLIGADRFYREALEINQRAHRSEGIALAYFNLGNVQAKQGDIGAAEFNYNRSLEAVDKTGSTESIGNTYEALANLHRIRGDLKTSEDLYRKALKIQQRLGNLLHVARDFGMLGVVLKAQGDLGGAEQMAHEALDISERIGDPQGMAIDFGTLGSVYQARGDLVNAEKMYREAIAISERPGRPGAEVSDYTALGDLLEAKHDFAGACDMYERALASATKQEMHGSIMRLQARLASMRPSCP